MKISENVALAQFSTMGLGGTAAYVTSVKTTMELLEALSWAQTKSIPIRMIGIGSNIVWRDEGFPGLIVVNQIERYESFKEDETNIYITAGSGENWDTVVARTAQAGLTGIEALSMIPGTTGATPVQNVGAYGQDISQTLVTIEAFDTKAKDFVTLAAADCAFGYRTSRFKTVDQGRFYITAITMHLRKANPLPPFYGSVQTYFDENAITSATPLQLRQAVMAIRTRRLPDPAIVKNCGSFFANPIISSDELVRVRAGFPDIPSWTLPDGSAKLPAAWLIEKVGFKAKHDPVTGMGTWPAQPLVLVNEKAHKTADLLAFKQQITAAVAKTFGVTLTQEPELLP